MQFADLLDALAATPAILAHGPSAVEVIDRYVLDSTKLNPEAGRLRDFLQGDPGAILIIEFYGDRADELPPRLDALEADLRGRGCWLPPASGDRRRRPGPHLEAAQAGAGPVDGREGRRQGDLLRGRHGRRPGAAARLHRRVPAVIARHGTTAGVYAHASVGCLHVRPVDQPEDRGRRAAVRGHRGRGGRPGAEIRRRLSGEHGDGLVRSPFQEKMFGPVLYEAFRELKRTFDPLNLLNPGKIVDAPPLTSNLRYGPAYVTPEVPTTFDFSADGGLRAGGRAVRRRRRVPQEARGDACAPRTRRPATSSTAPAAGPTPCGWR